MILSQFSPGFTLKSQVNERLEVEIVGLNLNEEEIFRYTVLPDSNEQIKLITCMRSSGSVQVQNAALEKTLMRADSGLTNLSADDNN